MTTHDFGDPTTWRKASRSADGGGDCVFVGHDPETGMVGVRDSKQGRGGEPHWFTRGEWGAFLDAAKAGEFDSL